MQNKESNGIQKTKDKNAALKMTQSWIWKQQGGSCLAYSVEWFYVIQLQKNRLK